MEIKNFVKKKKSNFRDRELKVALKRKAIHDIKILRQKMIYENRNIKAKKKN